jgi:gas vesicle protein
MTNTAKMTALVAGSAVIGAGIGLLLAPQSGADTRRQVRHYAKRAQAQAARISRSMKAGYERVVEQGKLFQENQPRRPVEAA